MINISPVPMAVFRYPNENSHDELVIWLVMAVSKGIEKHPCSESVCYGVVATSEIFVLINGV